MTGYPDPFSGTGDQNRGVPQANPRDTPRHGFTVVAFYLNEGAVMIPGDALHPLLMISSVPDEGDFPRASRVEELKGFGCLFKMESVGDRVL